MIQRQDWIVATFHRSPTKGRARSPETTSLAEACDIVRNHSLTQRSFAFLLRPWQERGFWNEQANRLRKLGNPVVGMGALSLRNEKSVQELYEATSRITDTKLSMFQLPGNERIRVSVLLQFLV